MEEREQFGYTDGPNAIVDTLTLIISGCCHEGAFKGELWGQWHLKQHCGNWLGLWLWTSEPLYLWCVNEGRSCTERACLKWLHPAAVSGTQFLSCNVSLLLLLLLFVHLCILELLDCVFEELWLSREGDQHRSLPQIIKGNVPVYVTAGVTVIGKYKCRYKFCWKFYAIMLKRLSTILSHY